MRVAIIGDSFTYSYKDTWIEKICDELNLKVIHQVGFRGQAQYRIYLEFLEIIKTNPDVIICCHTDYSRLYHPTEILHHNVIYYYEEHAKKFKNKNIINAAHQYFSLLYDENYAKFISKTIIENMQKISKEKNIKLVNIPCFEHEFIDKTYGLWFLCDGGLVNCSKADYNKFNVKDWTSIEDPRLNHFSPNGHQILANNIIPHIKTYITTDQEFHISLLYPEIFA
jgi:hypothetical protein